MKDGKMTLRKGFYDKFLVDFITILMLKFILTY